MVVYKTAFLALLSSCFSQVILKRRQRTWPIHNGGGSDPYGERNMEKSDPSVLRAQEWAIEQKPNDQYVQDNDQICKPSINHNMSPSAERLRSARPRR